MSTFQEALATFSAEKPSNEPSVMDVAGEIAALIETRKRKPSAVLCEVLRDRNEYHDLDAFLEFALLVSEATDVPDDDAVSKSLLFVIAAKADEAAKKYRKGIHARYVELYSAREYAMESGAEHYEGLASRIRWEVES